MGIRFDDLPGEAQTVANVPAASQAPRFDDLEGEGTEEPGAGGVALESLANLLSLVGVPNALAAGDVVRGKLRPGGDVVDGHEVTASERFHAARDEYAKRQNALFQQNPKSALGGALGTLLIGGNPEDVGRLALTAAAQSGLSSDELAKGDAPGALMKAGEGGAIAGLGGAALEGLGAGLGKLARAGPVAKVIEGRLSVVRPEQAAAVAKAAQGEFRSGVSAIGGETSNLLRLLDRAEEAVASPAASAEVKQQAAAWLASPAGVLAKQTAFQNVLEQLPGAVERVSKARASLEPLRQALTPEALESATDQAMANPITKQILPRVTKYAQRVVPAVIAQKLGGGAPGMAAGALVGSAMGSPATALGNMVRNPSVRALGLNAAKAALVKAPAFVGEDLAPLLAKALSRAAATGTVDDEASTLADASDGQDDEDVQRAVQLAAALSRPRRKR